MSKGPFTARIDKVVKAEMFNVLKMTHVFNEQKDELKMPLTADVSTLPPQSVITYYLADDDLADEQMNRIQRDERPVLVFASDGYGNPAKNENFLWLEAVKVLLASHCLGLHEGETKHRERT